MGSIVSGSSRTLRLKYRSSTDAVIGLDQRDVQDVVVDVDADGLALAPLLLNLLSCYPESLAREDILQAAGIQFQEGLCVDGPVVEVGRP